MNKVIEKKIRDSPEENESRYHLHTKMMDDIFISRDGSHRELRSEFGESPI